MCVLIVEDEFLIRDVAQVYLEQAGFEVLAAENGRHAFEHLVSFPGRFTCLVTDYHMPGELSGGHVIEQMRPLYPAIPMILASAHPHATTSEWRDHNNVELLVKPYAPEDLVELVDHLLK